MLGGKYIDEIILYFAKTKNLTAKQIQMHLLNDGISLSIAQVYNIINDLITDGLLKKVEGFVSINDKWLDKLEWLILQLRSSTNEISAMKDGAVIRREAGSFTRINIIREDLSSKIRKFPRYWEEKQRKVKGILAVRSIYQTKKGVAVYDKFLTSYQSYSGTNLYRLSMT